MYGNDQRWTIPFANLIILKITKKKKHVWIQLHHIYKILTLSGIIGQIRGSNFKYFVPMEKWNGKGVGMT